MNEKILSRLAIQLTAALLIGGCSRHAYIIYVTATPSSGTQAPTLIGGSMPEGQAALPAETQAPPPAVPGLIPTPNPTVNRATQAT